MTVPNEYRRASAEFDALLAAIAEQAGLTTRHQAYTMLQGVLLAFRRRLTLEEGIVFVQILPPMLRALFVMDWDPQAEPVAVLDRAAWRREVRELRPNHNISPPSAIEDVATVLWRSMDQSSFAECLDKLPPFAREFWAPAGSRDLSSASGSAGP
ncbi:MULTISPECIES: DUF2267 domain-containing protein [unclassified Devosia]|uniref:DUF2267 domain-containing protein n=1 Tax=unclassified Devosia TaxID=196773 RepID=UPI001551B0E1|nr:MULTISPECIES: DUF2267 domain-containing protein [unclassified Devosia]